MSDEPKPSQIMQLQIEAEVAKGRYANMALVNHTESEFVIDFALNLPGMNNVTAVFARVLSSPRHTKRLLEALQNNVQQYEQRYGVIEIADSPKGEN